jgi:hypothetical protein
MPSTISIVAASDSVPHAAAPITTAIRSWRKGTESAQRWFQVLLTTVVLFRYRHTVTDRDSAKGTPQSTNRAAGQKDHGVVLYRATPEP